MRYHVGVTMPPPVERIRRLFCVQSWHVQEMPWPIEPMPIPSHQMPTKVVVHWSIHATTKQTIHRVHLHPRRHDCARSPLEHTRDVWERGHVRHRQVQRFVPIHRTRHTIRDASSSPPPVPECCVRRASSSSALLLSSSSSSMGTSSPSSSLLLLPLPEEWPTS